MEIVDTKMCVEGIWLGIGSVGTNHGAVEGAVTSGREY